MNDFTSIEAESEVIGAILINNDAYPVVQGIVDGEHFSEPLHRQIFELCAQRIRAGKRATPVTLAPFLPKDTGANNVTMAEYLARLAASATTVIHAPDHAQVVRDLADRRQIALIGGEIVSGEGGEPAEIAAWAIDQLDGVVASRTSTGAPAVTMEQSVARAIDAAAAAYQRDGAISGLPTGLRDLDHKLLGMQKGDLVIIAARPGQGKSAVAVCIALNMLKTGLSGMFFSLEMGDVQLTDRMITDEMYDEIRFPYTKLRSGRFSAQDWDAIADAGRRLQKLPLKIEQQPKLTASQIGARMRQQKRRKGLDFAIVDHLHIMGSSGHARSRNDDIGEMTSTMKALAKELDIPIILLAQLSRGVEGREDKRPNMADLRDSGNIEQDADTIIMLYREAYYLERKEPAPGSAEHIVWQDRLKEVYHEMHMIVEKQRSGPIGTVKVYCDIASNAIRDLSYEEDQKCKETAQMEAPALF